jgi:hypothetical protein
LHTPKYNKDELSCNEITFETYRGWLAKQPHFLFEPSLMNSNLRPAGMGRLQEDPGKDLLIVQVGADLPISPL